MAVHIAGYGQVSPLGLNVDETFAALLAGRSAARFIPEWSRVEGLHSHVASLVPDYDVSSIPRSQRRTMSRMSEMACLAMDECLKRAGLKKEQLRDRRVMIIAGSTTGSATAMGESLKQFQQTNSFRGEVSTTVFKCMSHSLALNLAAYLQFNGPVISPSAACSTGAQAILLGKQMIESGYCDLVLAGGADECHITSCFSFDVALAASRRFNQTPELASRPFDRDRDGIVVSEGAAIVALESWQSLESRRRPSYGSILGAAQRCDGQHVSKPNVEAMVRTMRDALTDARVGPQNVGYLNAHATSTKQGDLNEALAVHEVFGDQMPVSSIKGHLGHSLAAAGSSEVIAAVNMLQHGVIIGSKNLSCPDPEMPPLHFVRDIEPLADGLIMSNSFAFGGMNVSLVLGSGQM
ncbi:beta-ketoacyl-[acyl-carrier-protein] synthase family protein [Bythopirellula polymerisocia]|uniref:3-oxoacyl-[acyl-carrier-protein] synthase 1 n=1 Tax=Bythopirellula polymerisocia TaxID=2528003 RepID=A0A5C6CVE2_9BACT|nr:beta-ketoacyl-[acyl-carrier-protein] synthase family protein [Bythopirellula polymerisocia]TWU27411.1 3-oxoacyl-[acyl-carrier-protein] synthase 1 [Bythopirellula polymerisocia]